MCLLSDDLLFDILAEKPNDAPREMIERAWAYVWGNSAGGFASTENITDEEYDLIIRTWLLRDAIPAKRPERKSVRAHECQARSHGGAGQR
jgi:hypothetical protein